MGQNDETYWAEFLSTLPARGATKNGNDSNNGATFLSTLPARGATAAISAFSSQTLNFYPRSPRGERPRMLSAMLYIWLDFYPRSPRGERRKVLSAVLPLRTFLSTLPARGATDFYHPMLANLGISIHAPREGSDPRPSAAPADRTYFYPRSPRGERLTSFLGSGAGPYFYPRSPRGERPPRPSAAPVGRTYFYPRSPRGERQLLIQGL